MKIDQQFIYKRDTTKNYTIGTLRLETKLHYLIKSIKSNCQYYNNIIMQ